MIGRRKILIALAIVVCAAGAAVLARRSKLFASGHFGRPITLAQCFKGTVNYCVARPGADGSINLAAPTAYWQSKPSADSDGLPFMLGTAGEHFHNIGAIGLTVFTRSTEPMEARCRDFEMTPIVRKALQYLEEHAELVRNAIVWRHDYDTQVNDVLMRAGWPSAFSQSIVVQAFLLAHCKTGEKRYLDLAEGAGRAFGLPVSAGGVRSDDSAFIWFQEVPLPDPHNPYILNAHLYAIETLLLLDDAAPGQGFRDLALKGVAALEVALPAVDTGVWNRYDLRPPSSASISIDGDVDGIESIQITAGTTSVETPVNLQSAKKPQEIVVGAPFNQDFDWRILRQQITMKVKTRKPGRTIAINVLDNRPNVSRRSLAEIGHHIEGSKDVIDFAIGLQDFGWGDVAPEYIPWHADLLTSIGKKLGNTELRVTARRWRAYADAFKAEQDK